MYTGFKIETKKCLSCEGSACLTESEAPILEREKHCNARKEIL